MPGDYARKDVCSTNVASKEGALCPVRDDLQSRILSGAKEDSSRKGLFLYQFTDEDIYETHNSTSVDEKCRSKDSRIFVSYTCAQT